MSPPTEDLRAPAPSRRRSALLPVLGIVLLLMVAYLVAGSRSGDSEAWLGVPELAVDSLTDFLVAVLLLLSILVVVMIGRAFALGVRSGRPDPRKSLWLGLAVLVLFVVGLWFLLRMVPEDTLESLLGDLGLGAADLSEPATEIEPDRAVGVLVWFAVLSLAVAGWLGVQWATRRRDPMVTPRRPDARIRAARRVLVELLDDAISALRAHPDPREATIAAWARLETALDVVGVRRRPADTPARYLARILEEVETSAPAVERLTAAYERAMFSTHRIDRSTQLESVDALVAVRDELRVLDRVDVREWAGA